MKQHFTISVFVEDYIGLVQRVTTIFTRRHINIESITASESEIHGIHRFTILVEEEEVLVRKVVRQIEKQVDVIKAYYHTNDDQIYQEMALYKIPTSVLANGTSIEHIIREHNARILTVEREFTVIEKTGYKEETQLLFDVLKPYGILEFARSGRVAVKKPMKEFKDFMGEVDMAAEN
jgi:acetolactate synthase-1/3 small subunit